MQNVAKIIKKSFSYTEILSDDDEIIRINLENSAWKIVKTAFLFHLIQYPSVLEVGVDSVKMAVKYFDAFHDNLTIFLNKKPIDKLNEYKNVVYKNLGKEMEQNTYFRQALGVHYNYWKEFRKNILPDIVEELQAEDIYVYEGKDGRKPTIMFYKKEK